jgi:hypothetical protein
MCPLCAQDARRRTYQRQRQEMAAKLAEAAQRLPKPVLEAAD